MKSKFHSGEIAVQTKAGVQDIAQRVSRVIGTTLPRNAQYFLEMQRMAIIGSLDDSGNVQARVLVGNPGFMEALDEKTIRIEADPSSGDNLFENLKNKNEIGLLAIELAARLRLKVKGKARLEDSSIFITLERAYAQCPKYIQAREADSAPPKPRSEQSVQHFDSLSDDLKNFLAASDTFFIASYHEDTGIDVSHRGGSPGFIKVLNNKKIVFPDYPGNSMFNTLGNISVNPGASLLFIDFNNGSTVKLSGEAKIIWDDERVSAFEGAERIIEYDISAVALNRGAVPLNWQFLEYSPFNPL